MFPPPYLFSNPCDIPWHRQRYSRDDALAQDLPSQATLSRRLTCLSHDGNINAVHEGLLRLVVWRLTSLAETGDIISGLLREGNAGPAANADTRVPHLVRRLNQSTWAQVGLRIIAGFTGNNMLEGARRSRHRVPGPAT